MDVVELRDNALPRPATILPVAGVAGRARAIRCGKAVGDQLETMISIVDVILSSESYPSAMSRMPERTTNGARTPRRGQASHAGEIGRRAKISNSKGERKTDFRGLTSFRNTSETYLVDGPVLPFRRRSRQGRGREERRSEKTKHRACVLRRLEASYMRVLEHRTECRAHLCQAAADEMLRSSRLSWTSRSTGRWTARKGARERGRTGASSSVPRLYITGHDCADAVCVELHKSLHDA